MSKILRNSIVTPDGTTLESTHVHDFVGHTDKNGQYYAVDGGNSYLKRSFDVNDYTDTSVYIDDDFIQVREAFKWGTYGKDGKGPLVYKLLCNLDNDHIQAIINTQTHLSEQVLDIFRKEQQFRYEHENSD